MKEMEPPDPDLPTTPAVLMMFFFSVICLTLVVVEIDEIASRRALVLMSGSQFDVGRTEFSLRGNAYTRT